MTAKRKLSDVLKVYSGPGSPSGAQRRKEIAPIPEERVELKGIAQEKFPKKKKARRKTGDRWIG